MLAVLEENKCPLLAALRSTASSGQISISYRKNKWERGQKCPQAKQSNKRGKDRKVWTFQLGHHPFCISLPPLTPSSDPLCASPAGMVGDRQCPCSAQDRTNHPLTHSACSLLPLFPNIKVLF